ncbi:MAG TPA: hypothetical protein LFV92_06885 [Rickettsia endosymbiont of Ceroptres masudai]|nr:hypothetical protein [Rickettsia endosymbiont of Ceroptres masudai]
MNVIPRGIVAWIGKTYCVTPWLDHGGSIKTITNTHILVFLTGSRGLTTG